MRNKPQHPHPPSTLHSSSLKKLKYVSIICAVFICVEVGGGILANSIAIISDAAHLLSDLLSFMISIIALVIASKPVTPKMTYGFHRAEVIGTLFNVLLIWGLTIWLVSEASHRLFHPEPVDGKYMLGTAIFGLICNLIMMKMLHNTNHGHHKSHDHSSSDKEKDTSLNINNISLNTRPILDLTVQRSDNIHEYKADHVHGHHDISNMNIRAAMIHVIGDVIQSVGVIIAAIIVIIWPHMYIVDPICIYLFSILVLMATVPLLRQCVKILLQSTPNGLDGVEILAALSNINGVRGVHDLHIWSLSTHKVVLSAHIVADPSLGILEEAKKVCREKFHIKYTTIQVEGEEKGCESL